MNEEPTARRTTRRDFLKAGGLGALAVAGGGALASASLRGRARPATASVLASHQPPLAGVVSRYFAASDGFIRLPNLPSGAVHPDPGADPSLNLLSDDSALFVFGFNNVGPPAYPLPAPTQSVATSRAKGKIQHPAPLLFVNQNQELRLRLMNVAFKWRPDLTDGHTIHFHGFRNAIAAYDGVPEVSFAVPHQREFPYVYRPREEGTYMYHCHFEDVEHVQQGMTGVVFVRPTQNGNTTYYPSGKYAYNDGDGSTAYDREFALLLTEIWSEMHVKSFEVQEFIWTDYKADYWLLNGRVYPDTVKRNGAQLPAAQNPLKTWQPQSSLIQVNPGDRVLLRFVNLGYGQQAMQLPGITMKIVGEDATLLRGPGGADLTFETSTIYLGPGESRDVIFTAPAYNSTPSRVMKDPTVFPATSRREYNRYLLKNRDYQNLNNRGQVTTGAELGGSAVAGLGGQVTEVRVYNPATPLGPQTAPNSTFYL